MFACSMFFEAGTPAGRRGGAPLAGAYFGAAFAQDGISQADLAGDARHGYGGGVHLPAERAIDGWNQRNQRANVLALTDQGRGGHVLERLMLTSPGRSEGFSESDKIATASLWNRWWRTSAGNGIKECEKEHGPNE